MEAYLRGFVLLEYFIGYDLVRVCFKPPGIGVRGPGTLRGVSNLIFARATGNRGRRLL